MQSVKQKRRNKKVTFIDTPTKVLQVPAQAAPPDLLSADTVLQKINELHEVRALLTMNR